MKHFINENLQIILAIWLLGFTILIFRLATSYFQVISIKKCKQNTENDNLLAILQNLQTKMRIKQNVSIKVTNLVQIPVMIGHLKPVILIPVSILSGFSNEQIEAIVAHELAHIKRNDYLLNSLQSVLEIIFFFHPAIWWLSSEIRKDREHSCDDIALVYIENPLILAKSLVQIQEIVSTENNLAMAFGKQNFTLLNRVKRIAGYKTVRNYSKEFCWVIFGLMITFFSFAQKSVAPAKQHSITTDSIPNNPDTLISWKTPSEYYFKSQGVQFHNVVGARRASNVAKA